MAGRGGDQVGGQPQGTGFRRGVVAESVGVSFPAINASEMACFSIAYPDAGKQRTIAAFLDREIAKVDAMVAKKERLIELLQEKRTALITHAVTKGLDPSVPMKDSGVEWLGKIPGYWSVNLAKRVCSVFVPQRNKPELNYEVGLPWITMEDITRRHVDRSVTGLKVGDPEADAAGSKSLPAGSVISSCVGNFGVASVNTEPCIINQQLQSFIPRRIDAWYLRYVVEVSKAYFEIVATVTTLEYVNQERFGEMPITLPPIEEQEAIVEFLDSQANKIDALIAKVRGGIEKLKELFS